MPNIRLKTYFLENIISIYSYVLIPIRRLGPYVFLPDDYVFILGDA